MAVCCSCGYQDSDAVAGDRCCICRSPLEEGFSANEEQSCVCCGFVLEDSAVLDEQEDPYNCPCCGEDFYGSYILSVEALLESLRLKGTLPLKPPKP